MALYIDTPIQYLKGVGPKLGDMLKKRGFRTLEDLFDNFPRSYEDRRAGRNIASLQPGEIVSLKAEILKVSSINMGKSRRKIYDVSLKDSSGIIHCKFFRVPYRGYFERFQPRMPVRVVGKVTLYRGRIELHHPDIQEIHGEEELTDELVPIYSETEGLSGTRLRKIVAKATEFLKQGEVQGVHETLPQWILKKYNLPSRVETILNIHNPPHGAGEDYIHYRSKYHRRIIFEEFFWLEMILAARKQGVQKERAPSFRCSGALAKKLQGSIPFELTGAQKRAYLEIREDLMKPYPMHRL
ncbi:MAG: ATP-dependent DNA helicase RecG, partial [Bdellovibrionales bacterium]|nr:ATP-dependent DNA helicase RecG [Bdellovibrionales bacterium]